MWIARFRLHTASYAKPYKALCSAVIGHRNSEDRNALITAVENQPITMSNSSLFSWRIAKILSSVKFMTTAKSRGHHLKHLPVTSAMGFGVKFQKYEFSSTQKLPLSQFIFYFLPSLVSFFRTSKFAAKYFTFRLVLIFARLTLL